MKFPYCYIKPEHHGKLEQVMPFGKYKGMTIAEITLEDKGYFFGILKNKVVKKEIDRDLYMACLAGKVACSELRNNNLQCIGFPTSEWDCESEDDWI